MKNPKPPRQIFVGSATVNQTPMDWAGNRRRILEAINAAQNEGIQLLVFPELCISGYGCEDVFHSPANSRRALESLAEIIPHTANMIVIVGLPYRLPEGLYNVAAFIADGELLGFYAKQHLAGDGVHYEPRWFRPWQKGRKIDVEYAGNLVPFGEVLFDVGGVRIGAEICEDAWVLERPSYRYAKAGTDIVVCPTASHFAFGKSEVRKRIAQEGSRSCACAYILSNMLGNESGRMIFDGQRLIFAGGELQAEAARFSYKEYALTFSIINLEVLRAHRHRIFSLFSSAAASVDILRTNFSWNTNAVNTTQPAAKPPHLSKEEEFAYALSLSLFDYMRKSRSRGFVISLSGGADSAACAALSMMCFQLAKHELGETELQKRLNYLQLDFNNRCLGLLDTIYQGTENSGEITRNAAKAVAAAVGARHSEWNVEPLVLQCRKNLEEHLGKPLNWEEDDLTLQNIQSRVRAPGVWMLANKRQALLLATGNRSECAVGYSTMDGDTAGSISPLAGIDKFFLRKWLVWLQHSGPKETGSIPALSLINEQQPTAELRPPSEAQTDEADLMPYNILDQIERLLVRDKCDPSEILEALRANHSAEDYSTQTLNLYVQRFIRLWSRNQWKRERYAPSFHLDDENLDPKTWCRFPILNSGFTEELNELNSTTHQPSSPTT